MWPKTEEEKRRGRNCGFVCFMERKDAEDAKDELNGKEIVGHEFKIGWGKAVPRVSHPMAPPSSSGNNGLISAPPPFQVNPGFNQAGWPPPNYNSENLPQEDGAIQPMQNSAPTLHPSMAHTMPTLPPSMPPHLPSSIPPMNLHPFGAPPMVPLPHQLPNYPLQPFSLPPNIPAGFTPAGVPYVNQSYPAPPGVPYIPPIVVRMPQEKDKITLINRLAAYTVKEGIEFEKLIMEKKKQP
eukprot:TRINITY_DN3517_c0_g2_i1.p1 TRINITY_DN3517_c0_g2~~TRINITY_DN3517_c0_g2_i1.p1  ORF type:complete len:239 (-),score=55.39 TRINITY_DN3517_c0_g2_i1:474-1190(-)